MYPIAHVGIGSLIILKSHFKKCTGIKLTPLFFGTLLPDLIDKPIFYFGKYLQVFNYSVLPAAGSRNYSHTILFSTIFFGISARLRSKVLLAISLGVISHQLIDVLSDIIIAWDIKAIPLKLIFWPLYGTGFQKASFANFSEHLKFWVSPYELIGEAVGLICLIYIISNSKKFDEN